MISCTPSVEQKVVYSVLHDTTDPLEALPEADELWRFTDGDNTEKHLTFRYSTISDVDMNVVRQLERPAIASGLFANAVQEKKRAQRFKEEFDLLFEQTDSIGASHSAIFKPILAELEYLANLPHTDKKYLIVYSNLVENSDWLSYYNATDLWHLNNTPNVIVKRYLEQVPKDANYRGVALHIVFKATGYTDNIRFKQLRAVYTEIFTQLNVPISFSANLTKAQGSL